MKSVAVWAVWTFFEWLWKEVKKDDGESERASG